MTIEELCDKLNEALLYGNMHEDTHSTVELILKDAESVRKGLSKSTVIPEGWYLIGIDQIDNNEFTCGIARDDYSTSKIKVSGEGGSVIEALSNAIEQIDAN